MLILRGVRLDDRNPEDHSLVFYFRDYRELWPAVVVELKMVGELGSKWGSLAEVAMMRAMEAFEAAVGD